MAAVKKNLVKEGTSTTGTGTLTLTAMTGWARFADAYAVSDVVPYAIENGDNKEVGLGTVGAGNTLARTTVLATLVAGVYDDTSPVAITLSGNSTVHSGPLAELFAAGEIADLGTAATAATGTSGHVLGYLDGANTFGASQIIDGDVTLRSTDPGTTGRFLYLHHNSASPAAGDSLGLVSYDGNNSAAARLSYGALWLKIVTATAGSEDGQFAWTTTRAGGSDFRLYLGNGLYSPGATGGDKGANAANFGAVYDDNVLLTCYAIDAYKTGTVDIAYWDSQTLDLEVEAQPGRVEERPVTRKVMRAQRVRDGARIVERLIEVEEPIYDELPVFDAAGVPVLGEDGAPLTDRVPRTERVVTAPAQPARTEVRTHGPAARFAPRAVELLDPKAYGASWKATGHLPAMPSPAEWEASGKKMSLGDILQRAWETIEVQAIHIETLRERIEALEAR